MYTKSKCQKSKSTQQTGFSLFGFGIETSGLVDGVIADIHHPQAPCSVVISSAGEKKTHATTLLMPMHYATAVINILLQTHRNITLGKYAPKAKMQSISLGWRVTPIRKRTGN